MRRQFQDSPQQRSQRRRAGSDDAQVELQRPEEGGPRVKGAVTLVHVGNDEDGFGHAEGYGKITTAQDGYQVDADASLELQAPDQRDGEGGERDVGKDVARRVEEAEISV